MTSRDCTDGKQPFLTTWQFYRRFYLNRNGHFLGAECCTLKQPVLKTWYTMISQIAIMQCCTQLAERILPYYYSSDPLALVLYMLKAIYLSTTLCRTVFWNMAKRHSNFKNHLLPSLVWSPSIPASKPADNRTALPLAVPEQAECPWRVSSLFAADDDPAMADGQITAHTGPSHKRTCPPARQR